jgi:glycosyltransferase involved in cell wall biosynthesis
VRSPNPKLVVVGDAPYSGEYKTYLKAISNKNVIFTSYLFDEDYVGISCSRRVFVLPSGIDGTRPVLLDQLGFGKCVLAQDVPATREVTGKLESLFLGRRECWRPQRQAQIASKRGHIGCGKTRNGTRASSCALLLGDVD